MTYPLREKFTKKHVHAWRQISAGIDMAASSDRMKVVRECTDCLERQEALMSSGEFFALPRDVLHLADATWKSVVRKRGCKA